jgi:hypothetical protein
MWAKPQVHEDRVSGSERVKGVAEGKNGNGHKPTSASQNQSTTALVFDIAIAILDLRSPIS